MKLTIFVFLVTLALVGATDYCAPALCSGQKHIACGNSGNFVAACPGNAYMVNLTPYISNILQFHNEKRNRAAGGNLSGYLPAARMATMAWDIELASLAALNVRQCQMKSDFCRNTDNFRNSGQNLAIYGYSGGVVTDSKIISVSLEGWFNQYANCSMNYINKWPFQYSGPPIRNFALMVADKNIRVGCGASRWFDGDFNWMLLACNYATATLANQPIYVSSTIPASSCTAKNDAYTSLCYPAQAYNLN